MWQKQPAVPGEFRITSVRLTLMREKYLDAYIKMPFHNDVSHMHNNDFHS